MAAAIRELADSGDMRNQIRSNGIELSKRFDRAAIAEKTNDVLTAVANGDSLPDVTW